MLSTASAAAEPAVVAEHEPSKSLPLWWAHFRGSAENKFRLFNGGGVGVSGAHSPPLALAGARHSGVAVCPS